MSSGFFQKVRRRFSGRAYWWPPATGSPTTFHRIRLGCVSRFGGRHAAGSTPTRPGSLAAVHRSRATQQHFSSRFEEPLTQEPCEVPGPNDAKNGVRKGHRVLGAEKEMSRKRMDLIKKDGDNNQCFIVWGFEHRNITKSLAKWVGFTKFTKYRSTSS